MKWLAAILGMTAAVSIGINLFCFRKLIDQYVLLHLDRASIFCKLTPEIRGDRPAVLFLGDSRAAQWEPLPVWEGYEIFNLGCSGATSADLLEQVLRMRYPTDTRLAVIQAGINDLKVIGICPERKEEILTSCKNNLQEAVRILRKRGIAVLLLPVFPPGKLGWSRRFFWSSEADDAIQQLNEELMDSIKMEGAVVLDCMDLLAENGRLKSHYVQDELHWNRAAYETLNGALEPIAVQLLGRSEP